MPPNLRVAQEDTTNNSTTTAAAAARTKKKKAPRRTAPVLHPDRAVEAYIPPYLQSLVHFYHGDFCYARSFHPRIVVQCLAEGFLTIACADGRILLPKLHAARSVVALQSKQSSDNKNNSNNTDTSHSNATNAALPVPHGQPQPLHVSKSTRRKASKFFLTMNQRFDAVVQGCRTQHGTHCWLYDSLVQAFAALHVQPVMAQVQNDGDTVRACPVQVISIEIWQQEEQEETASVTETDKQKTTGNATTSAPRYKLVAGELGYTVGTMYTSLTGFAAVDSAGSVQLAVTGRLLQAAGFAWWDLGMSMPYKTSLGAVDMPRDDFVAAVHTCRMQTPTQPHWMQPYQVTPEHMTDATHNVRRILDRTAGKIMDCT